MQSEARFLLLVVIFLFYVNNLYSLVINPQEISFGNTSKEEKHTYYIKIENNSDKTVEILGVINDCGLNLELREKKINPFKYTEGLLQFNSGTHPGYFVQYVKIIYKQENSNDIKRKNIEVRWFNKPESYSRVLVLSENINLKYISAKRPTPFFVEAINIGNKAGELILNKKDPGIDVEMPRVVEANKNIFIEGRLFPQNESDGVKTIILGNKDITTRPFEIKVKYSKKDDISINIGVAEQKEDKIFIPVYIDNYNLWLHPFEIELSSGEKVSFEKRMIKRGEKEKFFLVIDKKDLEKIRNNYIYFKIGVNPVTH